MVAFKLRTVDPCAYVAIPRDLYWGVAVVVMMSMFLATGTGRVVVTFFNNNGVLASARSIG